MTTALCTVRSDLPEKDAEPQANLSRELYVDQDSDKPSQETPHHHASALEHGKFLTTTARLRLSK
jgi:hypothetical protein